MHIPMRLEDRPQKKQVLDSVPEQGSSEGATPVQHRHSLVMTSVL
jgi:hypothetical protein